MPTLSAGSRPHKPERKDVVAGPGLAAWETDLGASSGVPGTLGALPPAQVGAGLGPGPQGGLGSSPLSAPDPSQAYFCFQLTKCVLLSGLG